MVKRQLIAKAAVALAVGILMLSGCDRKQESDATQATTNQSTTENASTEKPSDKQETTSSEKPTTQGEDEKKGPEMVIRTDFAVLEGRNSLIPEGEKVRSFLTGEWIEDTVAYRRPIAVMINNIEAGLPQRGISKADIIFEGQCEGSITRLMAVFQAYDELDTIGSIRSCRDYFPFLAAEYDAAYYHFGQSDFALQFLDDPELRTFNGMTGRFGYERRQDRVSPHNVFSTPDDLVNAMVAGGVSTYLDKNFEAPLTFSEKDEPISCPKGQKCLTLRTGYGYNDAYFEYNEEDGLYYRYEYGEPQIDELTGEQLAVKNILFKLVPGEQYWNGSPLYLLTGEGEGLYVTNGTAQWVTWSKEVDGVNTNLGCEYTYGYGPTTYRYADGSEVIFNQGKTWICIYEKEDKSLITILNK